MNLKRKLRMKCVYFAPGKVDRSGRRTYAQPVQRRCRWEDAVELRTDQAGNEILIKSVVDFDEDVLEEGVLWKGEYEALTDFVNPFGNPGASKIQQVQRIPNVDGSQTLYTALL